MLAITTPNSASTHLVPMPLEFCYCLSLPCFPLPLLVCIFRWCNPRLQPLPCLLHQSLQSGAFILQLKCCRLQQVKRIIQTQKPQAINTRLFTSYLQSQEGTGASKAARSCCRLSAAACSKQNISLKKHELPCKPTDASLRKLLHFSIQGISQHLRVGYAIAYKFPQP